MKEVNATKQNPNLDGKENHHSEIQSSYQHFFEDAYSSTAKETRRCMQTGAVLATGLAKGSVDEISKNPGDTAWKLAQTTAVSAMIGFAIASEAPLLATGAAVTGLCFSGKWLYDTLNPNDQRNKMRNRLIGDAAHGAYSGCVESNGKVDAAVKQNDVFKANVDKAASALGPVGADLAIGLVGGGLGVAGGARAYQGKFPFRIPANPAAAEAYPNYYMPPRFTVGQFSESARQYVFQPNPLEKQIITEIYKEAREQFPDFKIKAVGRDAHNMEEGPSLSVDYSIKDRGDSQLSSEVNHKLSQIGNRVSKKHDGLWLYLGSWCDANPLLLDLNFLSKK